MTVVDIQSQERDRQQNPRQLRAAGLIPATLYGKGPDGKLIAPVNLQVPAHQFALDYKKGVRRFKLQGPSALQGKTAKAHQVQYHTISHQILNIEFLLETN